MFVHEGPPALRHNLDLLKIWDIEDNDNDEEKLYSSTPFEARACMILENACLSQRSPIFRFKITIYHNYVLSSHSTALALSEPNNS